MKRGKKVILYAPTVGNQYKIRNYTFDVDEGLVTIHRFDYRIGQNVLFGTLDWKELDDFVEIYKQLKEKLARLSGEEAHTVTGLSVTEQSKKADKSDNKISLKQD